MLYNHFYFYKYVGDFFPAGRDKGTVTQIRLPGGRILGGTRAKGLVFAAVMKGT